MKKILLSLAPKISFLVVVVVSVAATTIFSNAQDVLFESEESKAADESPVYNRIRLISSFKKDIWLMQQSHHGIQSKQWDRLAIIVDKSQSPYIVKFAQLEPGPLEWSEKTKRVSFKVSCFICHSNGPRVIRAKNSQTAELSLKDQLLVASWNIRIKSYGSVVVDASHEKEDSQLEVPFRFRLAVANETLRVETCKGCHGQKGFLSRGILTRQNGISIRFMVERGYMPPFGFSLKEGEKEQVLAFLAGY